MAAGYDAGSVVTRLELEYVGEAELRKYEKAIEDAQRKEVKAKLGADLGDLRSDLKEAQALLKKYEDERANAERGEARAAAQRLRRQRERIAGLNQTIAAQQKQIAATKREDIAIEARNRKLAAEEKLRKANVQAAERAAAAERKLSDAAQKASNRKLAALEKEARAEDKRRDKAEASARKEVAAREKVAAAAVRSAEKQTAAVERSADKRRAAEEKLERETRALLEQTDNAVRASALKRATVASQSFGAIERAQRKLHRTTQITREEIDKLAAASGGAVPPTNRLATALDGMGNSGRRAGRGINSFLPGLTFGTRIPVYKLVGIGLAIQSIVPPALALAGALGPLTGLLGALPGLAVTGLGALTAGMLGMRGVSDALGTAWDNQFKIGEDTAKQAEKAADNAESLKDASDSLQDSLRDEREAQEDLNDAREEATRRLEDMRLAAERARQAEDANADTISDLNRELGELRAEGAGQEEISDQLRKIREAELDATEGTVTRKRAVEDLREAEKQGVNGMDEVVNATRALEDASRSVERAQRNYRNTQKDAAEQTKETSSAVDKLAEDMANLSPAGRDFVNLIRDEFFPLFEKLRNTAQEGLLPGLGEGLQAAAKNFPIINDAVGGFADALGDAAREQGELFGSREAGRDMELIFENSERFLRRSGDASVNWSRALLDIMVAARPILDWAGRMNEKLARMTAHWAESGRKSGELEDFFRRATKVAELVVETIWDLGKGLQAVGKVGAEVFGNDLLKSINNVAERFREWAESVKGQRELTRFFERWRDRWKQIGDEVQKVIDRYKELRTEGEQPFDAVVEALAESFSRAIPKIAALGLKLGGTFLEAFIQGFLHADVWGKLLITAWFISKLGGRGAIRGVGGSLAGILAAGMRAVGLGGGLVDTVAGQLKGRGSTPANPIFVMDVSGGGGDGKGPKVPPVVGGATKTALRVAARAVPVIAAGSVIAYIAATNNEDFETGGGAPERRRTNIRDRPSTALPGGITTGGGLPTTKGVVGGKDETFAAIAAGAEQASKRLRALNKDIADLRKNGVENFKELRQRVRANFRTIKDDIGENTAEGKEAARKNFAAATRSITTFIKDGKVSVKAGTEEMERTIKKNTHDGKEGLKRNFNDAIDVVRRQMSKGGELTRKGLSTIKGLMVEELKIYGFTPKQAVNIVKSGDGGYGDPDANRGREGGHTRAGGGYIGAPGERGRDNIKAWLGRGEAVLNAPQQRVVNAALRRATGMRGGLRELFARTKGTKHYMATGGFAEDALAFATGGYVPATGGPSNVAGGVMGSGRGFNAFMRAVQATFGPNPYVFSGIRPGDKVDSGAYSNHATGNAIDITHRGQEFQSGPPGMTGAAGSLMDKLHGWMGAQVVPKIGRDFLWRTFTGGNHWNHIHFGAEEPWAHSAKAMQSFLRTVPNIKGVSQGIPRVVLKGGPRTPLKQIIQNIFDLTRAGAQEKLDEAAGDYNASGPGVTTGREYDGPLDRTFPSHYLGEPGATLSVPDVAMLVNRAGLPSTMNEIVQRESGRQPGVIGVDPNGYSFGRGLTQITLEVQSPETQKSLLAIGSPFNPWKNLLMAKWMYDRSGLSPWDASGPYDMGGYVTDQGGSWAGAQAFQGGGYASGFTPNIPAMGPKLQFNASTDAEHRGAVGFVSGVVEKLREQTIPGLERDYVNTSARFDLSEEEFIIEGDEDTPPSFDFEAIKRRAGELVKLIRIQRKIVVAYGKLVRYLEGLRQIWNDLRRRMARQIRTVKKALHRLESAAKPKKKKAQEARAERIKSLNDRLAEYQGTHDTAVTNAAATSVEIGEARDERYDAVTGLMELQDEIAPLRVTPGQPGGLQLPEWEAEEGEGEGAGEDANLQAQLDQEKAKTAALEEFRRSSQSAFSVFQGYGDIGQGYGYAAKSAAQPFSPGPVGQLGLELRDDGRVYQIGGTSPVSSPFDQGGAGVVQNFYSPIPATSTQLAQIGAAATAGIAGQGARVSPREQIRV